MEGIFSSGRRKGRWRVSSSTAISKPSRRCVGRVPLRSSRETAWNSSGWIHRESLSSDTNMNRRTFLATAAVGSATLPIAAQNYSDYTKDPRPDVAEGTLTAGSAPGPVFRGAPVVAGPAPDALTLLQPLQRHATGYLEFAVEEE